MQKKYLLAGILAASFGIAPALADNGGEAEIKKAVEAALGKGAKVDSVRDAGALGLYEVVVGGEIVYTDKKATYLLVGDLIDPKNRRNYTEERKNKLSQIKFSELPLELAVKQVRGNGKRVIATFEDPNCGYCRKLAQELQGMKDVTIYTFVYPILSPDSTTKSKAIWCASDKAKAWNDLMLANADLTPAPAGCDTSAVDKVSALGRKLGIRGTPTIFFTDGSRVPGYIPADQIEKTLAKIGS